MHPISQVLFKTRKDMSKRFFSTKTNTMGEMFFFRKRLVKSFQGIEVYDVYIFLKVGFKKERHESCLDTCHI